MTFLLNLPAPGRCHTLYVVLTTWQSAVFLLNSRLTHFTATHFWAPLLPKLRGQFAEFLSEGSLARLRIFSLPTCVGLRYGYAVNSQRGFSWQRDWAASPVLRRTRARFSGLTALWFYLEDLPTALDRKPCAGRLTLLRHLSGL